MPHSRRPWSEDELAKLKSMAGKLPAEEIAAELGRSPAAINVTAWRFLTHAAPSFWPVRSEWRRCLKDRGSRPEIEPFRENPFP